MALNAPTNINVTTNTGTQFRVSFRTTLSQQADLYLKLEPRVYSEFALEIDAANIPSGTNRNNALTFQWSNAIFNNVIRGINYDVSLGLRTSTDRSAYTPGNFHVNRGFFFTSVGNHETPGFSVPGIEIGVNRTSDRVFSTGELEYKGTWHSYPKIVLTGQFNYCKLLNVATGAAIEMESQVSSGHVRVIQTDPTHTQYGLWGGANENSLEDKIGELIGFSDIRNFIIPAPNELVRPLAVEAYFFNRNNSTGLTITYPTSYFELGDN